MFDLIRSALTAAGQRFQDTRIHFCQLEARAFEQGRCALSGTVLDAATLAAVTADLAGRFPAVAFDVSAVEILREQSPRSLVVATNLTNLHAQPSPLAEMVSQLLNGQQVELLREQDRWAFVSVPGQAGAGRGYLGWAYRPYMAAGPAPVATHVVCEPVSLLRAAPDANAELVSRIFSGMFVHVAVLQDGWVRLVLAGDSATLLRPGLTGWVPAADLRGLAVLPAAEGSRRCQIVADAIRFIGVPYLWGGCTALGIDCSGFTQLLHRLVGLAIPRDADQQFEAGRPVAESYRPGDLLLFSETDDRRRITHVGVSLGGWRMIHSSRSRNGVYEDDVQAVAHLRESFVAAKTFLADGGQRMADGKWLMADGKWQMADSKWQMADGGAGRRDGQLAIGMESPVGARVVINGRERDYFAGCSYLGLQNHPALIQAAVEALQKYGLGTGTSRGGYGEHPLYMALEEAAARYFETEAALYFVSGYLGGMILLQGLHGDYERVFVDEWSHFSVRDAVQAVGMPSVTFHHLDAADLAARLRAHLKPGERPLVISDGVFPISGDIAAVPDYAAALEPYIGAILCLDDAHATGVIGPKGQGTAEYWADSQGLRNPSGLRICTAHTFSKALGCHGGVIAGSAELIGKLRRNASAFVAHSPSPLPVAAAAIRALELAGADSPLRGLLWANVARARAGLRGLGWPLADTPVPIICLGARPGVDLARLQRELFARDICVAHVTTYSSTPPGGALRVAVFATHTEEQIGRLVNVSAASRSASARAA
jgi:glycine C-acetyltransferase/8-amino-7-oxononanoate synthase